MFIILVVNVFFTSMIAGARVLFVCIFIIVIVVV